MADARVSVEEEGDTLEETNIEVHPSLAFEEDEVEYMGVYIPDDEAEVDDMGDFIPDPIIEEEDDVQPDPDIN